jgi:basic amino acid/polyamine antiporter, APA family
MKALFRKKPLYIEEESHGLKKHLGPLQLTSIGIGAIIGAGIFVITGQAAALYAGPAIVISFAIAAFICILTALCYAELSSLIPRTGGIYTYSYVAMGECAAWIVGWIATAQALSCIATVASGWSAYFVNILGDFHLFLPEYMTTAPFDFDNEAGWVLTGNWVNLPAVVLTACLGILVAGGVKSAARFNNFLVALKLIVILIFLIMGAFFIYPDNWHPFIPENTGVFGEFGWSGIIRGAGLVFFAYLGFETVATLSQETKVVHRDVPLGILGSLTISTFAYILVALVLTGMVGYTLLNVPDPMAVALDAMGPKFFFLAFLVKLAILAGLASVVLVMSLAQTRVFFAISKDGLLPQSFSKLSPKTHAPLFGSMVTAAVPLVASGLFSVTMLAQLVSFSALFMFAFACISLLVLRRAHPEAHRPFKVPGGLCVPILGTISCLGLIATFPMVTWIQLLAWLVLGLIIYLTYGMSNSKLANKSF